MSHGKPQGAEPEAAARLAEETVAGIAAALEAGRVPRGRRPLRQAAQTLQAAGKTREAIHALHTLARLELRAGDEAAALRPARAARKLALQTGATAELLESLDLLTRVYGRQGEHAQVRKHVDEWLQAAGAGNRASSARALGRLAVSRWLESDQPGALERAEEAVRAAEESGSADVAAETARIAGILTLLAGCPTAARDRLSEALLGATEAAEIRRLVMARGWASLCLDRPESAARDFRRVRRLCRGLPDPRPAVEAAAALALAEARHACQENNAQRRTRAEALADRAVRQSLRLRDTRLRELTSTLQGLLSAHDGSAEGESGSRTVQDAAKALVELARRTNSLAAVSACRKEVERLAALPPGGRPFACGPTLPLVQDLLRE